MDPDAVDLQPPAGVARHRPAPSGRDRGEAAAPGDELDVPVGQERREQVEPDRADEPEVLRRAPARLVHVLDRRVLEQPGERVQPQAAVGVHVREPDGSLRRERANADGDRHQLVHRASLTNRVRG